MFFNRRSRANATTLRSSRKALKLAVLDGKNDWIKSKHNYVNTMSSFGGSKSCWDALAQLQHALSKIRPSTQRTIKKEDGSLCKTSEENAVVFHTHFHNIHGLPLKYDATVIEAIPQTPVVQGYATHPSDKEILSSVSKLKEKAPGESGIPAKVLKILSDEVNTLIILKSIVLYF